MSLNTYLEAYNTYLETHAPKGNPEELYQPGAYILSLGGKRLRPVLVLLGHHLFEKNWQTALAGAHAIELFHNFSLVHDDIMDAADLRRGQATVHKKWNLNTAILSGDMLFAQSFQFLLQLNQTQLKPILHVFTQTAIEVCEGQALDMKFELLDEVSQPDYLTMIGLKTSVLLGAALKIGALNANASEKEADLIYQFGYRLGVAFQIMDDILDTFGEQDLVGKQIGGDILQRKKTILYVLTTNSAYTDEIKELYKTKDFDNQDFIEKTKTLFTKADALNRANLLMQSLYSSALDTLNEIEVPEDKKLVLKTFARNLMERNA